MRQWPGNVARFAFIVLVALASALVYGLGRLRTLLVRDAEARAVAVAHLRGRVLRRAMTTLGATFIKLGQVMSTRPDLFRREMVEELRELQDRLPPFHFRHVRRTIEGDLGAPLESFYASLDPLPVAAASVAQVHRGRLRDGTEVAVKVLRPDVRRTVERDGAILLAFARLVALHPAARLSDPVGHLRHFIDGIVAQTDLRREAHNYEVFRKNFAGVPGIVFPRVYPERSGARVMTMDFMRGRKVDALGEGDHSGPATAIRHAFFKMCFEDGFLHADLHPGNMLVTDTGDVAVLDVGLVLRIDDSLMHQFVDFARCVSMGTRDDFVEHLRRFHTYMDDVDWEAIGRDADGFAARFRGRNVSELEWGAVINDLFSIARRHRVRPVPEFALVLVGVVTAEGIGKMLNPHGNSFQEMAGYLLPVMQRRGLLGAAAGR